MYLPKCSLLVNGKGQQKFVQEDMKQLHSIIANTTVNGVAVNIKETNKILANRLQHVIQRMSQDETNDTLQQEVKCIKCNRSCKTRGVRCKNNHWVHYYCDRLSNRDIAILDKDEDSTIYECAKCNKNSKPVIITNTTEPNQGRPEQQLTLAQQMLAEEIECTACQQSLVDNHVSCESCNQHFHDTCIDANSNTCHACKGSYHQQSLDLTEHHLPTTQANNSLKI